MEKQTWGTSSSVPLSKAVRYGDVWYLSGEVAVDPETGDIVGDTVEAQTVQVLENLKRTLEAVGSSMNNVLKTTVFLTDMSEFQNMNAVYARYFPENPPARSTIGAPLANPKLLVEIELIAHA